jgi:hypothetical protein
MKAIKWLVASGVLLILVSICSYFGSVFDRAGQEVAAMSTAKPLAINQPQKFKSAPDLTRAASIKATADAPVIGKVGETLAQGDYRLTVTKVDSAASFGSFARADVGKKLVAVEVIIESADNDGVSVNPMYASLKDSDGYEYNDTFGQEPALKSQNDLPRGEKVRGWLTFEVPDEAKGLMFTYQPITFENDVRLRFDLGQ